MSSSPPSIKSSSTQSTSSGLNEKPKHSESDPISPASTGSHVNPFASPASTSSHVNPFASPFSTRSNSILGGSFRGESSAVDINQALLSSRYFHSRRLKKGTIERPWLDKKDPRQKWSTIIPSIGLFVGICIAGILIWDGLRSVVNHQYCLVLDENFTEGFNENIWLKEVEVGGYGNGQFEMTTGTDENVYIENGNLVIKPTLQDATLMTTNNTVNLTALGTCTSPSGVWSDCWISTNTTNSSVINPVKSGRISTRKSRSIKYGKIEVTAQMPAGDWLWPAIWMLPVDNTYGPWPASGEIDMMETRGNNYTYSMGGNNIMNSAIHWGPDANHDAWWKSYNTRTALHTTYAAGMHTFGVEWSDKYIFTYVDSRLLQVLYFDFTGPLYKRGGFPQATSNGTSIVDPWTQTGNPSTPFDQDFYLILNVAVGGTNGWFEDGVAGKPWVDASPTAKKDFWDSRAQWYPTWQDSGKMVVKSVKMWQQQGYNGC